MLKIHALISSFLLHRSEWEHLLRIVKCEIISKCSNDDMDAFVLRYI